MSDIRGTSGWVCAHKHTHTRITSHHVVHVPFAVCRGVVGWLYSATSYVSPPHSQDVLLPGEAVGRQDHGHHPREGGRRRPRRRRRRRRRRVRRRRGGGEGRRVRQEDVGGGECARALTQPIQLAQNLVTGRPSARAGVRNLGATQIWTSSLILSLWWCSRCCGSSSTGTGWVLLAKVLVCCRQHVRKHAVKFTSSCNNTFPQDSGWLGKLLLAFPLDRTAPCSSCLSNLH